MYPDHAIRHSEPVTIKLAMSRMALNFYGTFACGLSADCPAPACSA